MVWDNKPRHVARGFMRQYKAGEALELRTDSSKGPKQTTGRRRGALSQVDALFRGPGVNLD